MAMDLFWKYFCQEIQNWAHIHQLCLPNIVTYLFIPLPTHHPNTNVAFQRSEVCSVDNSWNAPFRSKEPISLYSLSCKNKNEFTTLFTTEFDVGIDSSNYSRLFTADRQTRPILAGRVLGKGTTEGLQEAWSQRLKLHHESYWMFITINSLTRLTWDCNFAFTVK